VINFFLFVIIVLDLLIRPLYNFFVVFSLSPKMEVGTMDLQIKKLFIILLILCFWVGCTQVKQIVTDVKKGVTESIRGEKESTPKAPQAADTGTTKEDSSPPAKTKPKDTKTTTPPAKKTTPKTTQPPAEEVFGPK
jgi:hypothetical protein